MPHKFDPGNMEKLERLDRRQWQSPETVLQSLGLKEGEVLLDVGCGPGYFTIPAARVVGAAGRVYAIDISLEMLMRVGQHVFAEGLANVTPVVSKETNIPLPDGCADTALLVNVLHEAEDPQALLAEIRRLTRPGGRLLILDWRREPTPVGPPVEERIDPAGVEDMAAGAGWCNGAPAEGGLYHWGLLFAAC